MYIDLHNLVITDNDKVEEEDINSKVSKLLRTAFNLIKRIPPTGSGKDFLWEHSTKRIIHPRMYPKEEKKRTRWELFAEKKGINRKKSRNKKYEDDLQDYVPKYGKNSKKNLEKSVGIYEIKSTLKKKAK
ncbi:putative RRS1-like ribosome biogenesis regulatory protein [Hamiltosporidium tvaerminnensis]|uniref:Ribosome biogenesis regulatory protein n=2 Tax=Hamiltosporidium TaxID=1176354 RepID=A0A4Q9LZ45_9MICR|nr:hypothetical protein LUQ84_000647 [Hamiltosporidium tvaerminnensis]TBU13025.1 putative RRS1-like ribosome biogenesis regulatory protein [Hamiltosporidium tvaerminnensis]